ncbi:MAG: CHRD domain-containing protein [Rhizobacter sp.]|nr:CHRD domain-containing protein [Rhizobacter sp.]
MNTITTRISNFSLLAAAALLLATGSGLAWAEDLKLSGAQEVPPVTTSAGGTGSITIAADGAVSGSVTTTGVAGTMAHIHVAAMGKNGPVIIPLTKTGDGVWSVPPGAKLNPEQMKSYQAGELYVNVHSDAHKGGEVRAQLKP